MHPPPIALRVAFPEADKQTLDDWWVSLSAPQRQNISSVCESHIDKCFLGIISPDGQHIIPKLKDGHLILRKKFLPNLDEWPPGEFQQRLTATQLVIVYDPEQQTFQLGSNASTQPQNSQPKPPA